ncbi:hypothetical protein IC582_001096 [Cucumis melo]
METLVLGFPFRVSIIPILPLKSLHSLICPLADFSPSSSPSTRIHLSFDPSFPSI